MKLKDIVAMLDAEVICGGEDMEMELTTAFASDMMSDVLAYADKDMAIITGLATVHAVLTAQMLDMRLIIFVRAKKPTEEMIELAIENEITLIRTRNTMFTSCGMLYKNGLEGRAHI